MGTGVGHPPPLFLGQRQGAQMKVEQAEHEAAPNQILKTDGQLSHRTGPNYYSQESAPGEESVG